MTRISPIIKTNCYRLTTISFILVLNFPTFNSIAQNHVIDSLRNVLKTEKDDTNKVNTLNVLSEKLWQTGKYDTSIICAKSEQALAEQKQILEQEFNRWKGELEQVDDVLVIGIRV